jgi:uncharacterized protein
VNYLAIIDRYYPEKEDGEHRPSELRRLLLKHSRQVTRRALQIADRHPEWNIDREFLEAAAMLHDIGICRCDAPGIYCYGTEPYIRHGVIGGEMIRSYRGKGQGTKSMEAIARVCERHTGTGLPGYEPETLEEQIICYADKFYSKSSPDHEKTVEEACRSLRKFGEEGVVKFMAWHQAFDI